VRAGEPFVTTSPDRPLAGRTALVTGSARRLGLVIARRLVDAGAKVALHAHRHLAEARQAARALAAHGGEAVALAADLADADACRKLVADAAGALGGLDLLVNNAAEFERTPVATLTESDFDRAMAVNARPVLVLTLAAAPWLSARGGAVVNLACTSGLKAWKGYAAYSASKAAVVSLTQSLAQALAPAIRVNAVAPGPVLAPDATEPAARAAVAATTLLGRWGEPSDVAEAVLFLATAPWLTGVVLPVDGGRSVR
jgi:pteridine reductase